MQIIVRQTMPIEYDAVDELLTAAFGQAGEAELVQKLRQRPDFQPEYSLVVVGDQNLVMGYALWTPVRVESGHVGMGLAPLAVHPAYQKRYLGSALMWESIERLQKKRAPFAVVLGDPSYYGRFDFLPAADFGLHCKWNVPAGAFQARELRPGGLEGVRGLVEYLPEFDAVT